MQRSLHMTAAVITTEHFKMIKSIIEVLEWDNHFIKKSNFK